MGFPLLSSLQAHRLTSNRKLKKKSVGLKQVHPGEGGGCFCCCLWNGPSLAEDPRLLNFRGQHLPSSLQVRTGHGSCFLGSASSPAGCTVDSSRHLVWGAWSPCQAGRRQARACRDQAHSHSWGHQNGGPPWLKGCLESLEAGALGARGSSRAGRAARGRTAPWPGRCGRGGRGSGT